MKRVIAAGAIAAGGLLTLGLGVANADEVQVEGSYSTLEACQVDGPQVEIAQGNDNYTHWDCRQGDDGLWYVWLSN
ncbi:hypothetical protein H7J93_18920 [Mycobacterium barrassiae]|jgi:hypothetical protein|uniref:hypothetical protein n=1 Tax=Mycobacterium barrassiae TaxID=319709 RepID=UPI002265D958|nr:hypothetical protein [Mycobacterium barrassiae]MCV7301698.1 hypothetical protein [Mycobacterium barrassiae]